MRTIVPDYSKFDNSRLLKLYDEIQGLNEKAAQTLLDELKNRALINDSRRREVKIPVAEREKFNNLMLEIFKIDKEEFILHQQGSISPQYFAKCLSDLRPGNKIMTGTAIVLGAVCFPLFYMTNSKIDLFDSTSPSFLSNYFIILLLLILPIIYIFYALLRFFKKNPSLEKVRIKKIVGKCIRSKVRVRRTLLYHYFARIQSQKFSVPLELYKALDSDYNLAFYYIEQTGNLLSIEVESSGKYEIIQD